MSFKEDVDKLNRLSSELDWLNSGPFIYDSISHGLIINGHLEYYIDNVDRGAETVSLMRTTLAARIGVVVDEINALLTAFTRPD